MGVLLNKTMRWNRRKKTFLFHLYERYIAQTRRCGDRGHKKFKHYGERGIRVEYSWNQFLAWFLGAIKRYNGFLSEISIGRIDNNRNYSLENIRLETIKSNTIERLERAGQPEPPKVVVIKNKTSGMTLLARSILDAAKFTGVCASNVSAICRRYGRLKSAKGFVFSFYPVGIGD